MSFARHRWVGFVAVALLGACGKGSDGGSATAAVQSAEDFCVQAVGAKCSTLAGCCQNGAQFDPFECRRDGLETCLGMVGAAQVHGGEARFDAAAAATCFASATSCPTLGTTTPVVDQAKTIACNNVLTGFSPLGSGCSSDSECAAPGGGSYPECFQPGSGDGVCAKAIFSTDGSCGFFADSLELRVCPNGGTCTIPPNALPPNAEGKARFDLHGTCTPLAQAGQPCGVLDGGATIQCAPGLMCMPSNGGQSVCMQPKAEGQPCMQPSECATMWCDPQTQLCAQQPGVTLGDGQYCYRAGAGGGGGAAGAGGFGGSAGFGGSSGFGGSAGAGGGACSTDGTYCVSSATCCSGVCLDGLCGGSSCLSDGEYCATPSQCCTGQCNGGVCGAPPSCGQTGTYCTSSSECCSGLTCSEYACVAVPPDDGGTCGGAGSYCYYNSDCCSNSCNTSTYTCY